jgi:hypothetical protein
MSSRDEDRPGPITQTELEELRRTVAKATVADIGATWEDGADPLLREDVEGYLSHFAAIKRDEKGEIIKNNPCLRCHEALSGDLTTQLFGRGGFTWGLAHGSGFCKNCGWPATLYHFIKDRNGEDIVTIRHVVLQIHPDDVEIKKPE